MSGEEKRKEEVRTEPERKPTEITTVTPPSRASFLRAFDDILEDFRRNFEELMRPWWYPTMPERRLAEIEEMVRYPYVDLIDEGDSYTVHAELPGLSKDQIELSLTNERLDLNAEVKEEKEETGKNYIHRERSYSAFRRCIVFPEEVVPEKAEAEMKKGVLTVKIPKKTPTPKVKPVKVEIKEE
ncbi:MAG: Hsp20/alpha crystallin family protein [Candidatus Freyrarchaeum guaymaensis]